MIKVRHDFFNKTHISNLKGVVLEGFLLLFFMCVCGFLGFLKTFYELN